MKRLIDFIDEWFHKLWRLMLYIGGMIALILEVVGMLHDGGGLLIFFDCMICILLPRICDEVFDPLLKKDNKED